jgi:hypothetical protein
LQRVEAGQPSLVSVAIGLALSLALAFDLDRFTRLALFVRLCFVGVDDLGFGVEDCAVVAEDFRILVVRLAARLIASVFGASVGRAVR